MMQRAFLVYLDDNEQKREASVDIVELNVSFLRFATNKNIITIPISRVIKMKEELKEMRGQNELG
jgi:hypothetical protein